MADNLVPPVNSGIPQQPPRAPQVQFKTSRGLIKVLLLTIITLGIFQLFFYAKLRNELNTVCASHNGTKTMSYWLLAIIITPITLGIGAIVWAHKFSKRVGNELKYRKLSYSFGAGSYWGWCILGSFIIVGPFIYTYKLCKAFNLINADYNVNG